MKILHPNNIIVGDSCRSIDCKDSGYSGDNCSWVEPIVPPSRQLPTTGGGRPPLRPSQVRKKIEKIKAMTKHKSKPMLTIIK